MYEGGPPPSISGAVYQFLRVREFREKIKSSTFKCNHKDFFVPGSTLSANDQPDNGPVILRTVTQTSSKELKEIH